MYYSMDRQSNSPQRGRDIVGSNLPKATILIVDDEQVVRRVLDDALRQTGYQTEVAADGQTALERLRRPGIDLILLDLQLGDIEGVEILKETRCHWPRLPVIILTAHGSLSSAIEAVRYGAADYLLKPVSMETLRTRATEVLQAHQVTQSRDEHLRAMFKHFQELMGDDPLPPHHQTNFPEIENSSMPPAPGIQYNAGPLCMDVQQHLVRMYDQPVELTPTEFAILLELVRHPGVVIPCTQIVRSVQHAVLDEEEARQIIRPHIVRLRRKLEQDPQHPIYIQSVRGVGYRWGTL